MRGDAGVVFGDDVVHDGQRTFFAIDATVIPSIRLAGARGATLDGKSGEQRAMQAAEIDDMGMEALGVDDGGFRAAAGDIDPIFHDDTFMIGTGVDEDAIAGAGIVDGVLDAGVHLRAIIVDGEGAGGADGGQDGKTH